MNKLLLFLKTIRLPNLLMLALVQYIVCEYLLQVYTLGYLFLVTSSTIFIALAGYLLNDLNDLEIDKFNNKVKWVNVDNQKLVFRVSSSLMLLGLGLGLIVSIQCSKFYFLLFMLSAGLLIAYAYFFSKYKIFGNFIISFLIALSILLCFYLGVEHPEFNRKFYTFNELGVWVYAGIAFMLNWIRELIKDLEDIEGDRMGNRKSLPILIGPSSTKVIVGIVLIFFIGLFVFMLTGSEQHIYFKIYVTSLIALSLLCLIQVIRSKDSQGFKLSSSFLKVLMFIGLLLPLTDFL